MDIQRPPSKQQMPSDAKLVFKGKLFDVYQWEQVGYDGKASTFEKITRADTVHIFPVTPQKTILLSREQQPGTNVFIAPPGGRVDPGEEPLIAAKRELLEEAGCVSDSWDLLGSWQMHPKIDWAIFAFIARDVRYAEEYKPQSDERITILEYTFDEFVDVIADRNFYDRELRAQFLEAKLDPVKMSELKNKILGD